MQVCKEFWFFLLEQQTILILLMKGVKIVWFLNIFMYDFWLLVWDERGKDCIDEEDELVDIVCKQFCKLFFPTETFSSMINATTKNLVA